MRTMHANNRKLKRNISREMYLMLEMLVFGKQTIKLKAFLPEIFQTLLRWYLGAHEFHSPFCEEELSKF